MPDALGSGLALLMALMPESAVSNSSGPACRLPERIPVPRVGRPPRPDEVRRMAIGGYTLALSWTPQFCASTSARSMQCDKRNGRFGFILHGLWPDGKGRSWPQYCKPASAISRAVVAENFCSTPSPQLMQHEWAKHGTCMAKDANAYFDRARSLYQGLTLPDMRYLAGEPRLTAGQLSAAIARKNAGMTVDMIRVRSNRYGMLTDVWVCLDTAFKPSRCPSGKGGLSRNARIKVRLKY